MILAEYHRFLQTLTGAGAQDTRKVANLVWQHFEKLQPLTTAQGQRIKKFVELAQANWDTISAEIQPTLTQGGTVDNSVSQLKNLRVGPFRGFAKPEDFNLDSSLVLIYGPNGTGKSSFCEALEYGLLGNVADAESKRFREPNDYLKNAYANRFSPPAILATNSDGEEVVVQANEAAYRFCFVEKNRIDSFSRIAAQAPAKQIELIATLFGLDAFNEFVGNFSVEIDGNRYIDLIGVKAETLKKRRQSLAGYEQQRNGNTEELKRLEFEESSLANQYREGLTFSQLVFELRGDERNAGKIRTIENELQQPIATSSQLTSEKVQELQQNIISNIASIRTKQQALEEAGQQVSFQQLYEAVSQVQPSSPEHCPACKTSLQNVAVNPYAHASDELKKLKHLAQLQQDVRQLNTTINHLLDSLAKVVETCAKHFPSHKTLAAYQVAPPISANMDWWNSLHRKLNGNFTPWQHLEAQVRRLEEADQAIEQAMKQRATKLLALSELRAIDTKITQFQTRRTTADAAITSADLAIADFEAQNTQLIADVAEEVLVIAKNKAIASAYADFVRRLSEYRNKLPALLVADLGDKVVELYNAFNRNDLPSEKLASVRLPLSHNQRLQISFQSEESRFFDALHVLSEGHIRCIGLAILLAKNLKENCPFLIFDDPVNAIDDDHRECIRKTLFQDAFFSGKQIILTCHGEEFFKDIHNLLPAARASQAKSFTFLPRIDESHIRVDFRSTPRNYIVSARAHFNSGEVRDALSKARRALEALAKTKLWSYVSRYGDGNLSIKMRSAVSPFELRNLTEQLRIKIEKTEFTDPSKASVLIPIVALLGVNGDSREWRYLNKGTHEEEGRAEFDRQAVQEIISALEKIDAALG